MKIDNRIFLPILGPYVLLLLLRVYAFVAGLEWTLSQGDGGAIFFFGTSIGAGSCMACFQKGINLGHINLKWRKTDG